MKITLALALMASASATLYSAKESTQKYLFEQFKAEHGHTEVPWDYALPNKEEGGQEQPDEEGGRAKPD